MKKIILLFIVSQMLTENIFSQQPDFSSTLTRQDYLQKSNRQKTIGWILLGSGAGMMGGTLIFGPTSGAASFDDAVTALEIFGIGIVASLSSIPFFISSGKNIRKAMSLSLKNEKIPEVLNQSLLSRSVPSINLTISL